MKKEKILENPEERLSITLIHTKSQGMQIKIVNQLNCPSTMAHAITTLEIIKQKILHQFTEKTLKNHDI